MYCVILLHQLSIIMSAIRFSSHLNRNLRTEINNKNNSFMNVMYGIKQYTDYITMYNCTS